jgi:uncharacterized protein (TIGR02453 family)
MATATKVSFSGFPREALRFLSDLEAHNDREWFQPRKNDFERFVRQPMLQLVDLINRDLAKQGTDYATEPSKAVYRIYRDTRFSSNKTPYKTHIGALLWHQRLDKNTSAALYFHLSTKELLIAAGVYKPMPDVLLPIRQHIAEHHERLRSILKRKALRDELGDLQGDSLSRPPKGWCTDHPAIDLLKRKDLLLEVTLDPKVALKPDVAGEIARRFRLIIPFVDFLNEPLLKLRSRPKDPLLAG